MNELALFAGAGGGILGGKILGWKTVCAVEHNPYAASVLIARQNDGLLAPFPIWDDVCTFDGRPWRGRIDVVSGGFPCQDISAAGKGAGIDGERSGLWSEFARIISEVQPRFAFVENSPMLTSRGLGDVLGDLAALGFDARWGVLAASAVGAPHRRERIWIAAHTNSNNGEAGCGFDGGRGKQGPATATHGSNDMANPRCRRRGAEEEREVELKRRTAIERPSNDVAHAAGDRWQQGRPESTGRKGGSEAVQRSTPTSNTNRQRRKKQHPTAIPDKARQHPWRPTESWRTAGWATEPNVGRVAYGVAARVDRLTALGNGQVPQCAAAAWEALTAKLPGTQTNTTPQQKATPWTSYKSTP